DHINSYKRIGKYTDPNGEPLDVLIVEVKTIAKLERARTALRNFVIKHLSKFDKDYALVAFYAKEDDGVDWRFSFIKLEHQSYFDEEKDKVKIKKEFTPAKRYSFLVGEYEQSHTAKTQLLPLLQNLANNPTVEDLESAFSIEKVTDEFFEQYKDLFTKLSSHFAKDEHIKNELNKANIDNPRFTKKLLGQIVFLYFLQKKGWLGVPKNEKWGKGEKRFIQNLFEKSNKENYFKDYLQPLFYEALAKERSNEHSFYKRFNCRIPFLNGGLFEAEYKWETANITIPENLFRNQEKNKAGDIGTGVLDVFDRYNFTIKEDEPLDKEVAVDPEMLGKVFENMLEITERKSKGAFYTPREIVHYMCQESLIHYLDNALNGTVNKQDIETYIRKGHNALENDKRVAREGKETSRYKYILPKSIRENADLIDQKLTHIKICDPAIGSGAFPVGLLHELVNAQLVIKPHFTDKYAKTKLKEFGFTTNVAPSESRYIYRLKRHIIQESIYGVDIDASAIDIARLRLWLSLVVDEDDFDPIETLPNLDYKIVCGNSLISRYALDMPIDNVFKEFNKKVKDKDYKNQTIKNYIGNQDIDLAYYKKLTNKFLLESSHDKKVLFRELIREIKNAFTTTLGNKTLRELSKARGAVENLKQSDIFGKQVGTKTQISKAKKLLTKLEKEKQETQDGALYRNAVEWRFEFPNLLDEVGDFTGFDVVIGNPPYIQLQKALPDNDSQKYADLYVNQNFETFERTGDIYALFYEKGIQTLTKKGALIYITSNKWMRANYGKSLRKYFIKNNPLLLLDLGPGVFDTATVDSNILQVENNSNQEQIKAITLNNKGKVSQLKESDFVNLKNLNEDSWIILNPQEQKIKDRIEKVGTPLKDWDININRGVLTGYNEAFIIDGKTKDELISQDPKSVEILKPILRGRDIKRYKAEFADLWLINSHNGVRSKNIDPIDINDYPAIKEHLNQHWDKISKRGDKGVTPYNLRNCAYLEEFEKENVSWKAVGRNLTFCLLKPNSFLTAPASFLTSKSNKYILAILHSSIAFNVIVQNADKTGAGDVMLNIQSLEKLPIPKIPIQDQKQFETIVDYIITLKENNKEIESTFFEAVIDTMVYELYFEQEIKQANKQVLKHLIDLKPIDNKMSPEEKLAIIQSEFERLYHPENPVRFAVETLDSIEEVRIIKEALK
ncbi:MAG: N-6 DNA methylase, partial [Flavobacteriaceae bacterium]